MRRRVGGDSLPMVSPFEAGSESLSQALVNCAK